MIFSHGRVIQLDIKSQKQYKILISIDIGELLEKEVRMYGKGCKSVFAANRKQGCWKIEHIQNGHWTQTKSTT